MSHCYCYPSRGQITNLDWLKTINFNSSIRVELISLQIYSAVITNPRFHYQVLKCLSSNLQLSSITLAIRLWFPLVDNYLLYVYCREWEYETLLLTADSTAGLKPFWYRLKTLTEPTLMMMLEKMFVKLILANFILAVIVIFSLLMI